MLAKSYPPCLSAASRANQICTICCTVSELCNEIHGAPWSGPSLKVYGKFMKKDTLTFIRCLAKDMSFNLTEVAGITGVEANSDLNTFLFSHLVHEFHEQFPSI